VRGAARRAGSTEARGAQLCREEGEAVDSPDDARYAVASRRRQLRLRPNQRRPAGPATGMACRRQTCGRSMSLAAPQQSHRYRIRERCLSTAARIRTRRVPKPGSTSIRAQAPRPRQRQSFGACSSLSKDSRDAHFHAMESVRVSLLAKDAVLLLLAGVSFTSDAPRVPERLWFNAIADTSGRVPAGAPERLPLPCATGRVRPSLPVP
jgi:hypothetical protein